jgi:hypothetical protein
MRGAEMDEKMRAAFGITGSQKMSLMPPARKSVFAAQAKVQRLTQGSQNTSREMRELAGATALRAPTDSICI